jgi:uncharacterized integral membrane protein
VKAKAILIGLLFFLAIAAIIQNTEVVVFRFLFWQLSMSRIIWLILFLLAGILIGYLLASLSGKKARSGKDSDRVSAGKPER